ncbi:MAG: helix-turn-helix transcriptional regulator [Dinoroseobacter sp.]|nr:helix-turn-helix transcriptional regulator [Dinoroseobacter sp.]
MEDAEKQKLLTSFGTALRKRRNALGWSQEELAHRAGITMRYVSLLETGKRVPTIIVFVALARALGLSGQGFMEDIEGGL